MLNAIPRPRLIIIIIVAVIIIVAAVVVALGGSSTGPTTSASGTCSVANLTVERAGPSATVAGTTYEAISFINKGAKCSLPGLVDARGYNSSAKLTVGPNATLRGVASATPVSLPAKATAIVQLGIGSTKACAHQSVDSVQFSTDGSSWVTVADPIAVCTAKASLNVTPFSVIAPSA
jgi:hypothetical protein